MIGDLDLLHEVLAEDVVAWGAGGAAQHAARKPILGRHRVALFSKGIATKGQERFGEIEVFHRRVNGDPGVVVLVDGDVYMVMAFELGPDGIRAVRSVLSPEKLDHLRPQAASWRAEEAP